jgi:uncharacterized protein YfkK (UPF0435 family)
MYERLTFNFQRKLKIKNIFKKQANKQTQNEDDIYIYLFIKKKTNKQTTAKKENKN